LKLENCQHDEYFIIFSALATWDNLEKPIYL